MRQDKSDNVVFFQTSRLPHIQCNPAKEPRNHNNRDQNANPLALPSKRVSIRTQHTRPRDATGQIARGETALAVRCARIRAPLKLIDHHPLEYVRLVIDIVENVLPEGVEQRDRVQEAADRHPEAVDKGHESEGDDEGGDEGGDEDDQGFGGEEVEKEPSGFGVRIC